MENVPEMFQKVTNVPEKLPTVTKGMARIIKHYQR
jgi:hypothetical protein